MLALIRKPVILHAPKCFMLRYRLESMITLINDLPVQKLDCRLWRNSQWNSYVTHVQRSYQCQRYYVFTARCTSA